MLTKLTVETFADPQALMRVLGLFAQRSIVPTQMVVTSEADSLRIELELIDVSPSVCALIA